MPDPFAIGAMPVLEKHADLLSAMNAAAAIKTIGDQTNNSLERGMKSREDKQKRKAPDKLSMSIDPALFSKLTPEERKELFFAIRRIKRSRT